MAPNKKKLVTVNKDSEEKYPSTVAPKRVSLKALKSTLQNFRRKSRAE